ncbi:MAG: GNAT family N-acetyltransferase [Alphaproteobacteria bacterium]|nr:MAG: GNAT family N-acetyltransferase [Alphaproteobacteria bacterium]
MWRMQCQIEWDGLDGPEWDRRFARLRRANLLQSRAYAEAVCPAQGQRPRRGAIRIDGELAGLVQIQEAALLRRLIHALILDRGPLWFEGFGAAEHARAFFAAFTRAFPARAGRRRRVIPELPRRQAHAALEGLDLAALPGHLPYQTIWLDLTPEPAEIRTRLRGKWRNALNRAERAGIEVVWDWSGAALMPLMAHYMRDRAEKRYPGPEPAVIAALARRFVPEGGMGIATAVHDGLPLGQILVFCHGRSATYQIGWTGEAGRRLAASHLLLWNAIETLRRRGIADFDLGGVNDEGAAGVKKFKMGLSGELVELAGQYR